MPESMTLPFQQIDAVFGAAGPRAIIEVGAADGLDTARYAARYPNAAISAFEPLERNVVKLRQAAPSATVFPFALGKVFGEQDFWESQGAHRNWHDGPWPYSSSLLAPKEHSRIHPWCTFVRRTVPVRRFVDVVQQSSLVDFVHLDVQGAELDVLSGFDDRLADVRAIWTEVSSVELYEGQPLYADVERFMLGAGFVRTIDTAKHVTSGDQFWRRA